MQVATLLPQLTEGVFSAKRLNAVAAQKNGEDLLLHMVREPFFISLGKKIPSVRVRIVHLNKSFGSKSRASAIRANVDNFVDLLRCKKTEYACRDAIFKLLEILFWSIRPFAKLFSPHKKSLRHLSVYGNRPMRHHIGYLRLFSNFSRHCRNL